IFLFSSRRRHTSFSRDWSSDVCSSDLEVSTPPPPLLGADHTAGAEEAGLRDRGGSRSTAGVRSVGTSALDHTREPFPASVSDGKIGRASCRERVQESVVVGS